MNDNLKPKIYPSEIIDFEDRYLIIYPPNGGWAIVDKEGLELAKSLNGERSYTDIIHDLGSENTFLKIKDFFQILSDSGLIESEKGDSPEMEPGRRPGLAVINLTQRCNLSCNYCYADTSPDGKQMPYEIIQKIIGEMLTLNSNSDDFVEILFHGGEPLLCFENIKRVVEYYQPVSEKIHYSIQTNATLLTEEQVGFFKKNNFSVGISIDGPEDVHDKTRPFINGDGSYRKVIHAIDLLRKENISCGVIVVLTSLNCDYIPEIIATLRELQVKNFAFNPFFKAGKGKNETGLTVTGSQLFTAYQQLLHQVMEINGGIRDKKDRIEERTIKYLIRNIYHKNPDYMCMRIPCGAGLDTLGFDVNGDVYPCDNFLGEGGYVIGNICSDPLEKILDDSDLVSEFACRTIDSVPKCTSCTWRNICYGICPSHAYFEGDGENEECTFRQLFIKYILDLISKSQLFPELLDASFSIPESKQFYFNINYKCNNKCVFCASDSTSSHDIHNTELDEASIEDHLKSNHCLPGDWITINGGEPTLSKDLPNILRNIANRNAHSHLFTNGRRLNDKQYCKQLMETHVDRISIPLFSNNAGDHDQLTGFAGSFNETMEGISNFFEIRRSTGLKTILELKLLFFKPTLETNPGMPVWILKKFPDIDVISLNSLIVSGVVQKNGDLLIPSPESLKRSLNETLDGARRYKMESLIQINDIPYCLIEEHNYGFLPLVKNQNGSGKMVNYYFDPDVSDINNSNPEKYVSQICQSCALINHCGFINKSYLNDLNAINSIKAVFPESDILLKIN